LRYISDLFRRVVDVWLKHKTPGFCYMMVAEQVASLYNIKFDKCDRPKIIMSVCHRIHAIINMRGSSLSLMTRKPSGSSPFRQAPTCRMQTSERENVGRRCLKTVTRYRQTSFRKTFKAPRNTCLIKKYVRTRLLFSPVFFAIPMFNSRKRVATCKLHCRPLMFGFPARRASK
jgi:hypothetical protein